ncbi:MAG: hypothetical protein IPP71_17170 [Bacteroidetes bacterium]|nr:hypothetical protein [Bacteroidota bacterium]
MKKIFIAVLCLGTWSSCYYDNASELYPASGLNQNCDTINVTYTKNIAPLFLSNCGTNNSCHSASNAQGGIILDNYAAAASVDDITLIGCIEQQTGFSAMPPSGKMSDCGINQIKIWIQNGKPQ